MILSPKLLSGHSFLLSNVLKANYKKKNGGVADLEWKASFADKRGVLNMSENGYEPVTATTQLPK